MQAAFFSEEELLELNRKGIIPGPNETEEEFRQRADYCLHLREELPALLDEPVILNNELANKLIEEAATITFPFFDIKPTWVPIVFSNHRLAPWHGGSAWIFKMRDSGPTGAFFQLRSVFADNETYLGLYNRKELIAHEISHIGRMAFEEPIFEEMLAYQNSRSHFRRYFGPIIQSNFESLIFITFLAIGVGCDLLSLWFNLNLEKTGLVFKGVAISLIVLGLIRLNYRHYQFRKCQKKLIETLENSDKANGVLYRLSDDEIIQFGTMNSDQIKDYATLQSAHSLRWRMIHKAYF